MLIVAAVLLSAVAASAVVKVVVVVVVGLVLSLGLSDAGVCLESRCVYLTGNGVVSRGS